MNKELEARYTEDLPAANVRSTFALKYNQKKKLKSDMKIWFDFHKF